MMFGKTAAIAILAALAGGEAHAQSVGPLPAASRPSLNLTDARVSIGPARSSPLVADQPITNRTSIDHTFGPQQVTASVGYLCGLQPPSDRTPGPASTFGPISTFLGGKLTYAFK
jgi:hypothetical protein